MDATLLKTEHTWEPAGEEPELGGFEQGHNLLLKLGGWWTTCPAKEEKEDCCRPENGYIITIQELRGLIRAYLTYHPPATKPPTPSPYPSHPPHPPPVQREQNTPWRKTPSPSTVQLAPLVIWENSI